ncbi:FtsQ-type POTRA domain-containing protein [uncultured Tyzzerella sp.]|uniref:cell division protein FtsQ/DivIB n=1 Tax=uncultured Tyzzerella sp. TaxID=2321398 RepID=UPI0029423C1C|nr:FtsQ-type POTRA domain-containing protein [uncultured Tyzzerella sp.]
MKKIYTYILIGVALIALIFMLLMLSPWLNIENIQINGIKTIEKSDIIRQMKLDKTTNILSFNSFVAKRRVKSNYYIENIRVTRKLPNTVTIDIIERKVVGYIPYINDYIYIDKDGVVIDVKSSYKEPLPMIYGLKFNSFIIGQKLKTENNTAFEIVMEITNAIKNKENLNDILKIDVSDLEDIHLYTEKLDVIIGNIDAINIKMNTLNEILKNFTPTEKGFLYIDDINKAPIFKYIT